MDVWSRVSSILSDALNTMFTSIHPHPPFKPQLVKWKIVKEKVKQKVGDILTGSLFMYLLS